MSNFDNSRIVDPRFEKPRFYNQTFKELKLTVDMISYWTAKFCNPIVAKVFVTIVTAFEGFHEFSNRFGINYWQISIAQAS